MAEEFDVIDRSSWNSYLLTEDEVEYKTTVRREGVDIEDAEGRVEISVFVRADGVDLRVGNLQLVVKGKQIVVLQSHPPYPIAEWTVLFEGEMVFRG